MLDFAVSNQSCIETTAAQGTFRSGGHRYSTSRTVGVLRRIAGLVPRTWMPIARRGMSGMSARLPTELRDRLHRLVGALEPDMA